MRVSLAPARGGRGARKAPVERHGAPVPWRVRHVRYRAGNDLYNVRGSTAGV